MPTTRRRYTRGRNGSVQRKDALEEFLMFRPMTPVRNPAKLDELRDYWAIHGDEMTAEHIDESPGTRPAPWWYWTHAESRPVANPADPEQEARWRKWHTVDGVLHTSIYHGDDGTGRMLPWQEPEADYLDRLGLLTDDERRALGFGGGTHGDE